MKKLDIATVSAETDEPAVRTVSHSPPPWRAEGSAILCAPTMPGEDRWGLMADLHPGSGTSPMQAIANAAFIVRAVNAHDELVKALEDMFAPLGEGGYFPSCGKIVSDRARQALARAMNAPATRREFRFLLPTTTQVRIAVSLLRENEGEREACRAVADWIETFYGPSQDSV